MSPLELLDVSITPSMYKHKILYMGATVKIMQGIDGIGVSEHFADTEDSLRSLERKTHVIVRILHIIDTWKEHLTNYRNTFPSDGLSRSASESPESVLKRINARPQLEKDLTIFEFVSLASPDLDLLPSVRQFFKKLSIHPCYYNSLDTPTTELDFKIAFINRLRTFVEKERTTDLPVKAFYRNFLILLEKDY